MRGPRGAQKNPSFLGLQLCRMFSEGFRGPSVRNGRGHEAGSAGSLPAGTGAALRRRC